LLHVERLDSGCAAHALVLLNVESFQTLDATEHNLELLWQYDVLLGNVAYDALDQLDPASLRARPGT